VSVAVSVVATLKDEADSVEGFLESLLRQTRTPEEIVLVDGGSTDGTTEALARAAERSGRVRVHTAPGSSISEGRNFGIARASGPVIAVTDAGTVVEPDWLEHLVGPFEVNGTDVSAGFFDPGGETWFERCLSTIITPQLPEIDPQRFLPSSRSVAFRKEWWERVGGYPEWLAHCEDLVFDMSLKRAGAEFAFAPGARVTWRARSSLRRFARQYFDYARGDGHAHLWPRRHTARYTAYAGGALLLRAGHERPAAWLLLGALASVYMRKFYARLLRRPPFERRRDVLLCMLVTPAVVVTGDVAKMAGYPIGLIERARAGDPARIADHRIAWGRR